jgi:DNA polymerase III epsilon subunit-like protein
MNPFSNNIIFLDSEFSSLNPYKGEILSIGLVKLNGEELYIELEYDGEVDEWVKKNVMPALTELKVSRREASKKIKKFVGDSKPYMISYVNQFDAIYLYKLLGIENNPFHWLPIDFASMLFAFGIDPERYDCEDKGNFYQEIGIDHNKYRKHHALDDARLLRQVYLKFVDTEKGIVKIIK